MLELEAIKQKPFQHQSKILPMELRKALISLFQSLLTYCFFLGLSYVIGRFIEIPIDISYVIVFLFGFIGIVLKVDDEKLKKTTYIPLLRHHFSIMYKINTRIGQSAQENTVKAAFKFVFGMVFLGFYFFWMNLLLATIKYLLSLAMPIEDPFRFLEAFIALLGAGVMAYILWFVALIKDIRKMTFWRSFGLIFKLYTLFQAFCIWVGIESLFLYLSPPYRGYIFPFLGLAGGFFGLLGILLLIIFIGNLGTKKETAS